MKINCYSFRDKLSNKRKSKTLTNKTNKMIMERKTKLETLECCYFKVIKVESIKNKLTKNYNCNNCRP